MTNLATRVEFDNYKLDGEVDSFPEPPLRIRAVKGGKACEVEGGIWLRNAVLLDAGEQRLLVQSFSGSGGELTFYDTSSCAQLARVELGTAGRATGDRSHVQCGRTGSLRRA